MTNPKMYAPLNGILNNKRLEKLHNIQQHHSISKRKIKDIEMKVLISVSFHCMYNHIDINSSVLFQIWIYGNSFESYLVVVVNLNKPAIEKWVEGNKRTADFGSLRGYSRKKNLRNRRVTTMFCLSGSRIPEWLE